jgi:predicted kinase
MSKKGTLIFFCGKMGAGKSTKAQQMVRETGALLLSEDDWLATIYPEEIRSFDDYRKYSARIKLLLKNHVRDILNAGMSVVMDFPGNTRNQRAWFKEICAGHEIPHKLVYLDVDDKLCLKQIAQRRKAHPERAQFDTEEVFHQVTGYFQAPSEEEGLDIEIVRRQDA